MRRAKPSKGIRHSHILMDAPAREPGVRPICVAIQVAIWPSYFFKVVLLTRRELTLLAAFQPVGIPSF